MMSTIAAKLGALALAPLMFFGTHGAAIQATAHADAKALAPTELACVSLTHNLYYGSRDKDTGGEVSNLQTFLKAEGYFNGNSTGYFGVSTARAVAQFQSAHNIAVTGYVGAATRAQISSMTCDDNSGHRALTIASISAPTALQVNEEGTWTVNVKSTATSSLHYSVKWGDENASPLARMFASDNKTQSSASFTHTYATAGVYTPEFTVSDDNGNQVTKTAASVTVGEQSSAPHITSLSADSGVVGSVITVTGTNFGSDSAVYVGSTKASTTVASDTSLMFTVPSVDAQAYHVSVVSGNEQSNVLSFTVTKAVSTRLSIAGVDAPRTLVVGSDGTWTLHVDSNTTGNLHYAVVWGDEASMANRMMAMKASEQSSSTFTHAYQTKGTYMPTFTVSDDEGHTASVSASIVVTTR